MMLRETGQSRRDKRDPSPLTGGPGGVSFIETDSRTVGTRAGGGGSGCSMGTELHSGDAGAAAQQCDVLNASQLHT